MHDLTNDERDLLEWLKPDEARVGECSGPALDRLMALGLVAWSSWRSGPQPLDHDFRSVEITDAGRAALRAQAS